MPCFPSELVRGQEVKITPKAMNSIYWAEPWATSEGILHCYDLKFEACIWLDL
ncbi:hypothetical protein HAX54_031817, partial [Datura stramonium]|nr:hypothetical protein [Datura stramonium]